MVKVQCGPSRDGSSHPGHKFGQILVEVDHVATSISTMFKPNMLENVITCSITYVVRTYLQAAASAAEPQNCMNRCIDDSTKPSLDAE